MAFVAVGAAIGGSALLGAGASIYGGMQQAKGAQDASNAMVDAQGRAINTSIAGTNQALAYLDPFRQYGLNAGSSLQDALYSPEQRLGQLDAQRQQLQAEVSRLQAEAPRWEEEPILSGRKASERRQQSFLEKQQAANTKLRVAQSKLDTFNQQYDTARQRLQQPAPTIEASPWYQFQADLLNRSMDRAFAARGLTGSGFEAEERRRGLIELGAGETERQFGRLKGLYDIGANAATAGANAITGNASNIANLQVGQGQAQAQGIQGVAGANANIATGIANSITGAVGAGLNYAQFQNLIAANKPTAPLPTGTVQPRTSGYESMNFYR